MKQLKNIAISILDAKDKEKTLYELSKANKKICDLKIKNSFSNIIHFDVMDNKFVPNVGVELEYIKVAKKYNFYCDVHLMVEKPIEDGFIDNAISYGADSITVHYEIENLENILKYLKEKNIIIGIALKPSTDINVLKKYEKYIDKILIMTVEPGYGGQKYITKCNEKIKLARELFKDKILQIDGGVNTDTIRFGIENGVKSFVLGNAIINTESYYDTLLKFNIINSIEEMNKKEDVSFDKNILMIKEGGYGESDILLGINVPDTRKIAKEYKKIGINFEVINFFLNSKYHEYRRIGIFIMSEIAKSNKKDIYILRNLNENILNNLDSINNWDLTDEVGPNIVGVYLNICNTSQKKCVLNEYLNSKKVFQRRIGIVALLTLVKNNDIDFTLRILEKYLYDENHLINKACGWVLREVYKKSPEKQISFLVKNNSFKKLPSILLNYACEKMTKEQKQYVKRSNL